MNFPKTLSPTSLLILLLTICILPCNTAVQLPVVHGDFIYEFYSYNDNSINRVIQADYWTITGLIGTTRTSTCNTWFILGGLNILNSAGYYERTYSPLPSHTIMFYVIYFIVIDDWSPTDSITIQFDTATPYVYYPQAAKDAYGSILCGSSSYTDVHYRVIGKALHNVNSLTLKVTSGVDGSNGAFGINSIKFSFFNDTTGLIAAQSCTTYDGGYAKGTTCPCVQGKYEDPANPGSCLTCSAACDHCFGGTEYNCYTCAAGYDWDGTKCVLGCSTGCQICAPDTGRCSVCLPTYALNWNYACITTCTSPLFIVTLGDYKFCQTPCQATNTFMLSNGTCVPTCNLPFQTRIESTAKFCDFPCNIALNEFLYTNGTCSTQCNFVQRIEGNYRFCDPCSPTSYFYEWDAVCIPTCQAPARSVIQGDYKACDRPCATDSNYYYIRDGVCRPVCTYPYIAKDNNAYCVLNLPDSQIDSLGIIGQGLSSTSAFLSTVGLVSSAGSFGSPGPIFIYALNELMTYIKYIDVAYPPKVQYLFDEQDSYGDLFPFIPQIPVGASGQFSNYPLPEKFEYYQIQSSFFVNSWETIIAIAGVLAIILMINLLLSKTKKGTKLHKVCEKVNEALRWNFCFAMFEACYTNVVLNTSLEARTLHLDNFFNVLSFITCILLNLLMIVILAKTVMVLNDIWSSKPKNSSGECVQHEFHHLEEKYKGYIVTFEDFKMNSIFQLAFVPIFALRLCLFAAVIGYLFAYPLLQSVLIVIISVLMIVYLAIRNPFKHIFELLEFLLQEVLILVVNICVLILAILDHTEVQAYSQRDNIGEVIIIVSFISAGLAVIYFFYHLWKVAKITYRLIKSEWVQYKKSHSVKPDTNVNVHNTSKEVTHHDISVVQNDSINQLDLSSNLARKPPRPEGKRKSGGSNPYIDGPLSTIGPLDETAEPMGNQSRHTNLDISWDNRDRELSYIKRRNSSKRSGRSAVAPVEYAPSRFDQVNSLNSVGGGEVSSVTNIQEQNSTRRASKPKSENEIDWKPNQIKRKK